MLACPPESTERRDQAPARAVVDLQPSVLVYGYVCQSNPRFRRTGGTVRHTSRMIRLLLAPFQYRIRLTIRRRTFPQHSDLVPVPQARILARRVVTSAAERLHPHRSRLTLDVFDGDVEL